MSPAKLRGHVSVSGVTPLGGETTNPRSTVLVEITVRQNKKLRAQDAANASPRSSRTRRRRATSGESLKSYDDADQQLQRADEDAPAADRRRSTDALKQPGLSLNEQLLLAIQLDQAQATMGQTIDSLTTAQQQRILAEDVQQTQIIQEAKARITTARSRRTSILSALFSG